MKILIPTIKSIYMANYLFLFKVAILFYILYWGRGGINIFYVQLHKCFYSEGLLCVIRYKSIFSNPLNSPITPLPPAKDTPPTNSTKLLHPGELFLLNRSSGQPEWSKLHKPDFFEDDQKIIFSFP